MRYRALPCVSTVTPTTSASTTYSTWKNLRSVAPSPDYFLETIHRSLFFFSISILSISQPFPSSFGKCDQLFHFSLFLSPFLYISFPLFRHIRYARLNFIQSFRMSDRVPYLSSSPSLHGTFRSLLSEFLSAIRYIFPSLSLPLSFSPSFAIAPARLQA